MWQILWGLFVGWVFFLGLLLWLSLKYCWKMLLVILQLSSTVKVIFKCLKSCSTGDWQRIANFLGTGGASQFGKQAAALLSSLESCGSDAVAAYCHIRDWMLKIDWFQLFLKERALLLSVWRKHHFVPNLSCWGKCHQGRSQHPKVALCSGWGQKREWWWISALPTRIPCKGYHPWGCLSPHLGTCALLFPLTSPTSTLTYVADKLVELVWIFSFCWRKCHQWERGFPSYILCDIEKSCVNFIDVFLLGKQESWNILKPNCIKG